MEKLKVIKRSMRKAPRKIEVYKQPFISVDAYIKRDTTPIFKPDPSVTILDAILCIGGAYGFLMFMYRVAILVKSISLYLS